MLPNADAVTRAKVLSTMRALESQLADNYQTLNVLGAYLAEIFAFTREFADKWAVRTERLRSLCPVSRHWRKVAVGARAAVGQHQRSG